MNFRLMQETQTIAVIIAQCPAARDFFVNLNLENIPLDRTLSAALEDIDEARLGEFGLSRAALVDQFTFFLEAALRGNRGLEKVRSLTIVGGRDKLGNWEDVNLTIQVGEIISIVGPTGSGKSRLLNDIECIAQKDTPTRRQILVNGKILSEEERFDMDGKLVAQLSQNMNFVMDLGVLEFLEMHAKSRLCENANSVIQQCLTCANDLAGEKFSPDSKVTQLSGGQSRALMIADTAYLSASPIVLIDEIENAGIDRQQALKILADKKKIVLISTHDPLLALSAGKRIIIKNGGIHKIIETSSQETESLARLEVMDRTLTAIRHQLRLGQTIVWGDRG
jgi:ABC-type lipoprotein export system ATPase subunit